MSLAIALNSRQQVAVVVLVTRPMCPKTALICLPVHKAISGCREAMAAQSHCPDQRRAMRRGWLNSERSA